VREADRARRFFPGWRRVSARNSTGLNGFGEVVDGAELDARTTLAISFSAEIMITGSWCSLPLALSQASPHSRRDAAS